MKKFVYMLRSIACGPSATVSFALFLVAMLSVAGLLGNGFLMTDALAQEKSHGFISQTAPQLDADVELFESRIAPTVETYCGDCHLDGADEGGVELDALLSSDSTFSSIKLWERVLKQVRHDLMPPREEDQPAEVDIAELEKWIKKTVFKIDPANPDPGHVIVRRLNRVEYRNTIKALMDYEVDTHLIFPPDDTGHGFDNMAEVLTMSPLLMEKYIDAATEVVNARVPVVSGVPRQRWFGGADYQIVQATRPLAASSDASPSDDDASRSDQDAATADDGEDQKESKPIEPAEIDRGNLRFFYSGGGLAKLDFELQQAGDYKLHLTLRAGENYVEGAVDDNRCLVKVKCDGELVGEEELAREGGTNFDFLVHRQWTKGKHDLTIEVVPLVHAPQTRRLRVTVNETRLVGPLDDPSQFVVPDRYSDFFPRSVPDDLDGRREYARDLLFKYAKRAYRRPPEKETVDRLLQLAESVWSVEGATFEKGVAQSMIAILSSPNFIFRETYIEPNEGVEKTSEATATALVDEYTLASRLSYFLWSSMPDDRMIKLADEGKLRENFDEVVRQMVKDKRFNQFYENFVGQWLRTRDIEGVAINEFAVLRNGEEGVKEKAIRERINRFKKKDELTAEERAELKESYRALRKLYKNASKFKLTSKLRSNMRRETEMLFEHVLKTDSDLVQLIDCDFTFLNERLATHYGIQGVKGEEMRRFKLDPKYHRGGILTHGSLLAVTSNPDRTSPVKRGVFVLENLLGLPPGAPPPDIPSLEESTGKEHANLTLRQTLAMHRADPMCSSCHDRMDPLGLALENFDALGRYRTKDAGEPVDASGELISGETFENIDELKGILAKSHKGEFYRCLTEKLLTYALGRSVEYYDLETVDQIVSSLESGGGRPKLLFEGIVKSPAFQSTRIQKSTSVLKQSSTEQHGGFSANLKAPLVQAESTGRTNQRKMTVVK